MHKSNLIKIMEEAAVKASRGLVRDFGEIENLQISKKGVGDFVTSADLRSERVLIRKLNEAREDYSILSEESGFIEGSNKEYCWIIDPLDGTKNYMHGIPHFCVNIALEKKISEVKKEIVAAVTFAPILNELFWAEKGTGTYMNDRRLNVSIRNNFESGLFASYPWHGRRDSNSSELICRELSNKTANVRIMGSAALELAYVAAGKIDAFWHDSLNKWDIASGVLLVREARGIVTDISGGSNMLEKGSIVATNADIEEKVRSTLERYYGA